MDRITQKHLNSIVGYLNKITGFENKELWTTDEHGKNTATVGMYYASGAYGGVALYRMVTTGGGVCDVFSSGHMTKRDLYNRILAYVRALDEVRYGDIRINPTMIVKGGA